MTPQNDDPKDDLHDDSAMVAGVIADGRVKVVLLEKEHRTEFSKLGTEMIITKAGRSVEQHTRYDLSGNSDN